MAGTYWLTILPETSKLESGIRSSVQRASRGAVISPRFDTSGANKAGVAAGKDLQSGIESGAGRGGGLGRLLRIDNARSTGEQAGNDINSGLASANVGAGLNTQVEQNLSDGRSIGARFGSALATGLKTTAVVGAGVAVAGIAGAMKAGFGRLTAIDDASAKLRGLGNDTAKVDSIMKNALASVKGTSFGLDEAATTAATAVAAGIEPGDKLTKYLKLTADAAAIAGTSLGEMGSIFNSVQTSGKAMTGEMRMLADRGLPVWTWLQEETGLAGEELSKFVSDGGVSADMFRKIVADNISDAALNMGDSVSGSLKNLKASYSRFGAELSGPIFAALKPLAGGFTAVFDDLTTAIKPAMADMTGIIGPWAQDMAARMTAWAKDGGIQRIVAFFGQLRDRIAELTTAGGRSDALNSITQGALGLGEAARNAGPALQTIGTALGAFGKAMIEVGPDAIQSIMVPVINMLAMGLRFLADNASWAVPTLVALGAAFVALRTITGTLSPIMSAYSASVQMFRTPIILAQTAATRQQAAAMTQLTAALTSNTVAATSNTVATTAGTASTIRGRIAAVGHAIATRAQAVATRAAAMGQWLLNAALTANPIGLIIAAVVAIGVALVAFFTKTELGRKIWDKAWTGIKAIAGTIFDWLKSAVHVAGEVIMWLWNNAVTPAFSGISAAISLMWDGTKMVWDALTAALGWVGDKVMWLWQNITVPAFEAIGAVIGTMWNGVKVVWDGFTTALQSVGDKVIAFKDGLVTAFNTVKDVVMAVWDKIGGIIDSIGNGVGKVGDFLKGAGSVIVNTLGLDGGASGGQVASRYASGGKVNGPGGGTSDSILGFPAMVRVSDGEYIVNAAATRKFLPILNAINGGMLPGFAGGGLPSGKAGEGGLQGNSILVARLLSQMFPQIASIGGYRANGGGYADHPDGRALDIMIPDYQSEDGIALGNTITSFLHDNADKLNLDYTIWRQTYRNASGASNVMDSRGSDTADHFDHVHVTTKAGSPQSYAAPTGLKLPASSGMDGQSLGASVGASGGSTSYRAATDAELSASSSKVSSTSTAVDRKQQQITDYNFDIEKANRRIAALRSEGKDTTDAEEQLRRKTEDLANATADLATLRGKAADAQSADTELRTKGKAEKAKGGGKSGGGMDGADFGQMFVSGLMESIGLDGSLFSNPLEWPTVKSAMAGINFLGGMLSGGQGDGTDGSGSVGGFASGAADAVGLGGMLSAIPGVDSVLAAQSGSPALTPGEFNPAVAGGSVAAGGIGMSAFTPHGQGAGSAPGPNVDNSININGPVGMAPADIQTKVHSEQNARTRTYGGKRP